MNMYDELLAKIKELESELRAEIEKKNKQFFYEIRKRKVVFDENILKRHKEMAISVWKHLREVRLRHIIGTPIIYAMLIPIILLDIMVTFYQFTFFPLFQIKRVKRRDYIIVDRKFLGYLNPLEKMNCSYCGYFNGVISYVREVAGRTEYRFCPIKHATTAPSFHQHYTKFVDYGDAESCIERIDELDRLFREKILLDPYDLDQIKSTPKKPPAKKKRKPTGNTGKKVKKHED